MEGRGGEYLHPHQSFAATHVNVSKGKSSIIDRCTERSLATVAAGAIPIKIGSATAATAATAAMSRRVGLSTCPSDECAQWAPIHSFIPSRLSVNHRRQSRRRHRHGVEARRGEQPQLNPNAARCSMILKKFLFIFKQSEEWGRGRGEDRHANVARQVQGPRSWPQVK